MQIITKPNNFMESVFSENLLDHIMDINVY